MSTQTIARMAVEVDGQGDPAVMIHGLGGTSNTFSPLMGLLGSRFRVIRPDLPGSGRSTASAVLSIQGFVDRIVAVTHALGVHRAHFAGHSLGTIVCLHLAAQQPSLVRSLALFGPLLALTDAARRSIRDRATVVRAEGMQSTADTIVQGTLAADTRATRPVSAALVREMLMRQDPEGYARTCEALAEGVAPIPQAIGCPCLLVTGDEDPVAPPASVRAMADRIVGARTIVLSRCGHWATFERPVEVMKALADFYFGSAIRAATERRPARHSARIT